MLISSLCLTNLAHADPVNQLTLYPLLTVGGAAVLAPSLSGTTTLPIEDPFIDSFYIYDTKVGTQTLGALTIFAALDWPFAPHWSLQGGIEYVKNSQYKVTGTVTQGPDVQSENIYDFSYYILSQQFMAEAKLLYNTPQHYHPYLLLGLGASFNQSKDFDTNVPPYLTYTHEYQTNTQTNFTYAVGLGVDVDLISRLRFGMGYRFTGLGKSKFIESTIDGTEVPGTLSQVNMNMNEILMQLTWIF
jgi:opacity protein-like surface antigen